MWEVIGPVEGGDTPKSNMDMQSSKNRFVVSGDTLAGMFMVTELTADDNAPGTKNSQIDYMLM